MFVLRSAKLVDLERDGRYALHANIDEAAPSEFMVRGVAREVTDTAARAAAAKVWSFTVDEGVPPLRARHRERRPRGAAERQRLAAGLHALDRPVSRRGWVAFAVASVMWGIPYFFIKVAVDTRAWRRRSWPGRGW